MEYTIESNDTKNASHDCVVLFDNDSSVWEWYRDE